MPTRNNIYDQISRLQGMYTDASNFKPDVTSGIFGEEARFKKGIGTAIAAGGDSKGTYRYAPLFDASANFSGQRMQARTAGAQARIMNMLKISQGFDPSISALLQDDRLQLEREKFEYDKAFNWGDILGLVNVSANISNPFSFLKSGGDDGKLGDQAITNLLG